MLNHFNIRSAYIRLLTALHNKKIELRPVSFKSFSNAPGQEYQTPLYYDLLKRFATSDVRGLFSRSLPQDSDSASWYLLTSEASSPESSLLDAPVMMAHSLVDAFAFLLQSADVRRVVLNGVMVSDDCIKIYGPESALVAISRFNVAKPSDDDIDGDTSESTGFGDRLNSLLAKTPKYHLKEQLDKAFKRVPGLADKASPDYIGDDADSLVPIRVSPAGLAKAMKSLLAEHSDYSIPLHVCQDVTAAFLGFEDWQGLVIHWKSCAGTVETPCYVFDGINNSLRTFPTLSDGIAAFAQGLNGRYYIASYMPEIHLITDGRNLDQDLELHTIPWVDDPVDFTRKRLYRSYAKTLVENNFSDEAINGSGFFNTQEDVDMIIESIRRAGCVDDVVHVIGDYVYYQPKVGGFEVRQLVGQSIKHHAGIRNLFRTDKPISYLVSIDEDSFFALDQAKNSYPMPWLTEDDAMELGALYGIKVGSPKTLLKIHGKNL